MTIYYLPMKLSAPRPGIAGNENGMSKVKIIDVMKLFTQIYM
jgi:hypothetical protein